MNPCPVTLDDDEERACKKGNLSGAQSSQNDTLAVRVSIPTVAIMMRLPRESDVVTVPLGFSSLKISAKSCLARAKGRYEDMTLFA